MSIIKVLLVFLITATHCAASDFWIVTRVTDIKTDTACLAKTCFANNLLFRISHAIPRFNETSETEWSANSNETEKQFTSVWTAGLPEDVQAQLSVINYDPSFGFPRVCDTTSKVSFFKVPQYPGFESSENVRTYRLQGRCFNATLLLQKHEEKCPWCQDSVIDNPQMLSSDKFFDRLSDPYFLVPLIVAAVLMVTVIALLITLICVLTSKSAPSKESCDYSYAESALSNTSSDTSGSFSFVNGLPTLPRCPVPSVPVSEVTEIDEKYYTTE
uniref:Uroplakin-3b n=1 Tax=Panagrellus redivivus TaxID=6233 RepID=A0A7E4VD21_PANRE